MPVARTLRSLMRVVVALSALLCMAPGWADEGDGPAAQGPASKALQGPTTASMTPLRLALQWRPQSQFAGFYIARERGIYRAHDLDVELVHADEERSSLAMLRDGEVELATAFLTDAIIASVAPHGAASPGILQIAQLVQDSNLMLVAWRDMGITTPRHLDGMRVSHWQGSFSAAFDAFFAKHGVQPVRIPQAESVNLFLKRGVAATAAMRYNEYHRIWQAGVDDERLTTFMMSDHGLNFPEDGIYARADWVRRHPGVARAVREATLAGWDYARAHPEEALDLVLAEARRAGVAANRPHARWMLEHLLGTITREEGSGRAPGVLDAEAYERTAGALRDAGLILEAPAQHDFAPFDGSAYP